MNFEYHDICKWLPYKPETIAEIAQDMRERGYREDRPIILFHGKILDGRHRYEAALEAGVEPQFQDFTGTTTQAIDYVTSENVKRRMLTNREKEFFYAQRAEALGVRKREDTLKQNSTDGENSPTVPSQQEHADSIGVHRDTVKNWEKDRKEIVADPELSKKAKTFDGYVEAKKEVQKRRKEAEEAKLEFNSLSDEEKIERLGGAKKVDAAYQRKLDETLGEDFNPYNAATAVLISLNRLRIFGGKKEIEKHIMSELDRSARMQKYEAEALILLAQIVSENYDEIASYTETKPKLKLVN